MTTRDIPAQIGDLPPIGRPANSALLLAGITELAEVAKVGKKALLSMHGIGPKAIRILDEEMTRRNIMFAE